MLHYTFCVSFDFDMTVVYRERLLLLLHVGFICGVKYCAFLNINVSNVVTPTNFRITSSNFRFEPQLKFK